MSNERKNLPFVLGTGAMLGVISAGWLNNTVNGMAKMGENATSNVAELCQNFDESLCNKALNIAYNTFYNASLNPTLVLMILPTIMFLYTLWVSYMLRSPEQERPSASSISPSWRRF